MPIPCADYAEIVEYSQASGFEPAPRAQTDAEDQPQHDGHLDAGTTHSWVARAAPEDRPNSMTAVAMATSKWFERADHGRGRGILEGPLRAHGPGRS